MSETGFITNLPRFNRNMTRYVDELGMAGNQVVFRQAGLLSRTFISITPPRVKRETAKKIEDNINSKIASVSIPERAFSQPFGGKAGRGDVHWYAWSSTALFGVKRDADMLSASADELYDVLKRIKPGGRIDAGWRGKQHVWIRQKITARAAAVKKVIDRLKKRIGRLKAAWAVCWQDAGAPTGSSGAVPDWVMQHVPQSRQLRNGFTVDNLGVRGHPSFSIVNNAAGVSQLRKLDLFEQALKIRCKAMETDLALYASGVKKVNR